MEQQTILIVDDNKEIVFSLGRLLEYEGYHILKAYDGLEALEVLSANPVDLILLDVMMPRLNGLSALMKLRQEYKVSGLIMGADDYIAKPYNPAELTARIAAQLRRYHTWGGSLPQPQEDRLVNGGLVLDRKSKEAIVDGASIKLTAKEYKILELLMEHPEQVFPTSSVNPRWYTHFHISQLRLT